MSFALLADWEPATWGPLTECQVLGVGPLREALWEALFKCVSLGARKRAGGEMGASVPWAVETGSQVFAGAGINLRLL